VAAQNQAYEAGFSAALVDIIDGPRLAAVREDSLGRMIKALELLEASKSMLCPLSLNFLVLFPHTIPPLDLLGRSSGGLIIV